MSTKTMRLPPRRVVTPLKKREEREAVQPPAAEESKPTTSEPSPPPNHLLAGYLAHEFLVKGTLFGQPWDPAQVELSRRGSVAGTKKRRRATGEAEGEVEVEAEPRGGAERRRMMEKERYAAVANLLRSDGAHCPGIVNPTQLANFLYDEHLFALHVDD